MQEKNTDYNGIAIIVLVLSDSKQIRAVPDGKQRAILSTYIVVSASRLTQKE